MKSDINKIIFGFIRIALSVLIILFIVYEAINLSKVGYDFGYRVFTEPAVDAEPGRAVLVQLYDGISIKELSVLLEEKGLVRDAKLFYLQTQLSVYRKKLVPGVYTLNTAMTAKEMLEVMSTPVVEDTESTEGTEPAVQSEPSTQAAPQSDEGTDNGNEE